MAFNSPMATPSSGLHAFGLNDSPLLYTDAVRPYEDHPFAKDFEAPQWSHQDFSAKKAVCIANVKNTVLGTYGESAQDKIEDGQKTASSDKQRATFLEEQKRTMERSDSPTMKELFQPGDKDEGDAYWGVIREGRDESTPHWSHWQFSMKKTHHATGVNKSWDAAKDVNSRSAAHSHYRDPKTVTSSCYSISSRRDGTSRSSERFQSDSSRKSYTSHAHLALAKRRHATQLAGTNTNQSASTPIVMEAMQSPDYHYFSDRNRFSRPSSTRRTSDSGYTLGGRPDFRYDDYRYAPPGGSPGATPYPAADMGYDDYSIPSQKTFGAEISLSPRVIPLKSATPGYSLAQISRQEGIELEPFYDRSLGCLPRGSPDINPTALYRSHAELASHKTLCKTDIKHTPNFTVRPASNMHSSYAVRRNSQSDTSRKPLLPARSKSADPAASTRGRRPRQMDMRASPRRPDSGRSGSGRSGAKTSRRRAATADGGRR